MITLATLPEATEQEVFDQVVNHLLTQKEKCQDDVNGFTLCRYRANGKMCAAGCLISEEEYKSFQKSEETRNYLEGHNWSDLIDYGRVPDQHEQLIIDLQVIHDETPPEEWEKRLKSMANAWGLKFNPPTK